MLEDTLSDSKTRQRGYFNQSAIRAVLDEHRRGRRDNSRHLWALLTLELWQRAYIDGDCAATPERLQSHAGFSIAAQTGD